MGMARSGVRFRVVLVFGLAILPGAADLRAGQPGAKRYRVPVANLPQTRGEVHLADPGLDGSKWLFSAAYVLALKHHVIGTELATPHVKWASPLRGPKLRLLIITSTSYARRRNVEIQQRLDAAITVIYFPGRHFWQLSYPRNREAMRNRFLPVMRKDYDCILYWAGVENIADAGDAFLKRLHEMVENGTGFVYAQYAYQARHPKAIEKLITMIPNRYVPGADFADVTPSDHPAVRGIAFRAIHGGNINRNKLRPGVTVIARHEAKKMPAVAVGTHGKGRLVTYTGSYVLHFGLGVPEEHGRWYRFYEQVFAGYIRAILWAARREAQTVLTWDVPPRIGHNNRLTTTLTLKNPDAAPTGAVVEAKIYDDEHHEVRQTTVPARGTMPVALPGPFRAGRHLLNARLLDRAGHVLDWVSAVTEVASPVKMELEVTPEVARPTDTITCTVSLDGAVPKASRTALQVTDPFDRLLFTREAPAAKMNRFRYALQHPRSRLLYVRADLTDAKGHALARVRTHFTCPRFGFDDYHVSIWPKPANPVTEDLNTRLLREAGITGLFVHPRPSDWFLGARGGFALWGGNLAAVFGQARMTAVQGYDKHPDRMKYPPLSEGFEKVLLKRAQFDNSKHLVRKFGLVQATLQDEGHCNRELSWDKFTLGRFRTHLKGKHKTLGALNARWQTAFKSWDAVVPSKTADMGDARNVARWFEFRTFMDRSMAMQMRRIRDQLHKAAGTDRFSIGVEGIWGIDDHFIPYGLYNFEYMVDIGGLDGICPYAGQMLQLPNGGGYVTDLFASLCTGDIIGGWRGYDHPRWMYEMGPWWDVFHGNKASSFFSQKSHIIDGCALLGRATWIEQGTRELRHGVGKLLIESRCRRDGIGIYFNFANYQLAWILGRTRKYTWMHRLLADGKASIERALQDSSLTPRFVTDGMIRNGALEKIKVMILNGAFSMAPETVAALKRFVERGGVLVADVAPAVYDPDGVPLKTGPLDDLFGFKRTGLDVAMVPAQYTLGVKPGPVFPSLQKNMWLRASVYETGIEPTTAKAYGRHIAGKEAPAFLAREVGKGKTLYMNVLDTMYLLTADAYHRHMWKAICRDAGVQPLVHVEKDGHVLPFFDTKVFTRGTALHAGIIRSQRFGAILPEQVQVRFPRKGHLYDVRDRRYLGHSDLAPVSMRPGQPVLVACLPAKVEGVRLATGGTFARGSGARLDVRVLAAKALDTVVRVEVMQPDGALSHVFTRNVRCPAGQATVPLRFALNEAKGQWTVRVKEVVSGHEATGQFEIR